MARLGWIGLGDIGTPMALRLLDAGHTLEVWGRTAQRLEPARARGAQVGASAAALAESCEAVFLCVTDSAAVESVVFGPGGLADSARKDLLIVDHSTISPEDTVRLGTRLRDATGAGWVDAPVSGGAAGARAGTLAVFCGGEDGDIARARPWLEAYGKNITHLGAAGTGQIAKSCNQAIFGTTIAAWMEVLAYARAAGLDVRRLVAALDGSWSDSPVRRHIVPHLARAREQPSNGLLEKDLRIVTDLAQAVGVELPLAAIAATVLRKK